MQNRRNCTMSMNFVEVAGRPGTDISIRDRLLFALTLSSGAVDAISFLALGKVFTAFVTGNIAFLGLAIAQDPRAPSIVAVLASMAGFAVGIYLATRIVSPPEPSAAGLNQKQLDPVWPQRTTHALGVSLLPHLCFALVWATTNAQPGKNSTLVLLALWALAMGMQSAAARRLNVGGIFTTAATATFIFLVGDLANVPLTREERHRLTGVILSLMIGATLGGLLLIHLPVYAPLFPFIVTLGVVAIAATVFPARDTRGAERARQG
jgi:uncharacterized membrane protein YoaK (UPF0700 family)